MLPALPIPEPRRWHKRRSPCLWGCSRWDPHATDISNRPRTARASGHFHESTWTANLDSETARTVLTKGVCCALQSQCLLARRAMCSAQPRAATKSVFRAGGEVVGCNIFVQVFQIKWDNGRFEAVPFSQWTEFFKLLAGSKANECSEIDPTDVRIGARVRIVLDSNEATALSIVVLPGTNLKDLSTFLAQRKSHE
jgi:hypothetical protein